MKKKVLVVGSLNVDMVVKVERFPKEGETVLGSNFNYNFGGKGANQACACAKLGATVSMLGCVGDDDFGVELINNLSSVGIDISKIAKIKDKHTGMAIINVDSEGHNNIVVVSGANMECNVDYIKQNLKLIDESSVILLQREIPGETVEFVINYAKSIGKKIIVNPAPASLNMDLGSLENVDYLTPNETELDILTDCDGKVDIDSIKRKAKKLLKHKIRNVLVTMGENGVLFVNEDGKEIIQPAFKVKAIDTVAAGDCFNGALAVSLVEGKSIEEGIMFANAASAIAVTREGAQNSIPSRSEVNDYLNNYK